MATEVRCICDICKERPADMSFKIKRSNKSTFMYGDWSKYEKIDVCNVCGNKFLGVVNHSGVPPVPSPKPR